MRKNMITITILLILCLLFLLGDPSRAEKKGDLFNEILRKTNSSTVEYGIKEVFTTDSDKEKIVDNFIRGLGLYDGWNSTVLKNNKVYCVEFGKNYINGYIEIIQYENHNVVTINITKKDNDNNLNELKDMLKQCIPEIKTNDMIFLYLKAKLLEDDINLYNNEVLEILKNYRASNINTIKLENGYSTTAYTRQYNAMQNNGKPMDFNYAVCRYSSGSYIIIGTPEISVTY
ncbi:YwmB family TATA-box binding protein [Clostridium sp. DJ247]|uniref:YwmB family TATA-box binding protein n=1 Tax=Clostridium sp. DJ247 TaxID=2726188 RepID=UPI0016276988|nr:YwmB family TATA-box binding protein [Clostridium sp. DJ247]MBC2579844.1 hypothetical protein [Clostridium sp. DJ247]